LEGRSVSFVFGFQNIVLKYRDFSFIVLAQMALNSEDEKALFEIMSAQEFYWNKGDIERFMEGYWILHTQQWDENTIQLIGKFTLTRENDQPTGYFTLLFKKIDSVWKIVSDHSSSS